MNKSRAIIFEKVSKSYIIDRETSIKKDIGKVIYKRKKKFKVIKNISFTINKGETIGFYGPNGSGKTTILKLIAGITFQDEGKVIINGSVAPVIELGVGLHPSLTGKENIFFIQFHTGRSK